MLSYEPLTLWPLFYYDFCIKRYKLPQLWARLQPILWPEKVEEQIGIFTSDWHITRRQRFEAVENNKTIGRLWSLPMWEAF